MKKYVIPITLVLLFIFAVPGFADEEYPVMPAEAWVQWLAAAESAPKAKINEEINYMLYRAGALGYEISVDLSDHIDYDPNQRNQGSCGNCWVWAGTGVMEIAHDVDDGVFDRLSIQFLDSCKTDNFACCGGNLGAFATWYSGQAIAVPWANTNASFADGARNCASGTLVTCGSISTTPHYPLNSITAVGIETHSGQAAAITNIKNVLNQNKGVVFGFALPDSAAWGNFRAFWRCDGGETEATLWEDVDSFCGQEWNEAAGEAGAHAVVIYGYNDDDADSANHYWLVLNSWGTAGGDRPNGFFRVPMMMNYDCSYPDNDTPGWWAFGFETLDVDFGNAVPVAEAGGPYNVDCGGVTTSVSLDGSGSFDLEDGTVTYSWTTDCPGGIFDDPASETPVLTVSTSPGCSVSCNVSLVVTDSGGESATDSAAVTITDTIPPTIICPADITIECDESTDPSNTGSASVLDDCDPAPIVSYTDVETPGACAAAKSITRTWTAVDACENTSNCAQVITVVDTTPPVITCPADITIECDESTDPSNTGNATATDNCDPEPAITYTDVETPGDCAAEKTIARTWTATDDCENAASCVQTITVVDTTPPVISCNAPPTMIPPDAPISFTATATDNCDPSPSVTITGYSCAFFTKKGKIINKAESCVVEAVGNTITILDSGGIGDRITWTVSATDECGNASQVDCVIDVVKKK